MPEARLHVTDPQGRRVVPVDKALFTIGRRTAADLQVVSTDVSREHAEIAHDAGAYVLRDRGSRYGTFVNGEQVTERPLKHGDRIRLGRTDAVELVFSLGDMESSGLRQTTTDVTDLGQMAAILNGLRALGSGRVLDEVLTLVMDSALDVTKADRGFIMLANLAGDLMDGNLAAVHEGTIAIGIRHVMCVPLRVRTPGSDEAGQVIGVLYLDGRDRNALLSKATLGSLEAFATQAALAIESARLYAESAEKARIDRDLRVAADIQQAMLPEPTYDAGMCDLAAVTVPCRTVGGDFYDYVDLAENGFGFALGDVAGKGPPAALLAATVQSNFVAHAPIGGTPAETIARINKALLRRAIEARFATMFYGVVTEAGQLLYCNAGQEPPLVLKADGE